MILQGPSPHTGTLLGSSQSSVPRLTPQKSSCPSILHCFLESSGVLPPACLNPPAPICVVKCGVAILFSQLALWLLVPQLFEAGCAPAEHRSASYSYPFPPHPYLLWGPHPKSLSCWLCSFSSHLPSMAPSLSLRQLSFRV